jgi:hypothetical protein
MEHLGGKTVKRSLGIIGILTLAGLFGCSRNKTYVKNGEIDKTINQQAESSHYIEALGIGAADSTLTNTTQRRATSRDAAIVQAQYEMLSYVKGVQLEGGITVEKAMETDSKLESYIKEVIKGAEIVKNEWTNDDGCVVTLRLDKKKLVDGGLKLKS